MVKVNSQISWHQKEDDYNSKVNLVSNCTWTITRGIIAESLCNFLSVRQINQFKKFNVMCDISPESRGHGFKPHWIFQASIRNCKNCVHNCEDHSSFDFTSAVQCMIYFIYNFIIHTVIFSFLKPQGRICRREECASFIYHKKISINCGLMLLNSSVYAVTAF